MSTIFSPFRSLGLITSSVPLHIQDSIKSKGNQLVVPAGDRFNIYSAANLALKFISDSINRNIECLTGNSKMIFASAGNTIYIFKHRKLTKTLKTASNIICALLLVDKTLIVYDTSGNCSFYDITTLKVKKEIKFEPTQFAITKIFHPRNYKNKVIFASTQGSFELWNISSFERLYWFKGFDSSITSVSETTLGDDVVCFGLKNGRIIFHNILYDKILLKISQPGGSVTGVAFRGIYDFEGNVEIERLNLLKKRENKKPIYFVSSNHEGDIFNWVINFEDGSCQCRCMNQTNNLHYGKIVSLHVLPTKSPETGKAVECLVSQGADNCLKISVYDRDDCSSHVVFKRTGHFMPPTKIIFWPGSSAAGALLVSCGKDKQIKIFSVTNERFDKSLGFMYADTINYSSNDTFKDLESLKNAKASLKKQRLSHSERVLLPEVVDISASDTRAEQWDNLVLVHKDKRLVTTWDFVKATKGRHGYMDGSNFYDPSGTAARSHKETVATSSYMSRCGNYLIVGYSSGDVVKMNIQSGQDRGSFGSPRAHKSPIVFACCTITNKIMISVSGNPLTLQSVDLTQSTNTGEITFWDFHKATKISSIRLNDPEDAPTKAIFNPEVELLAIALGSGNIILVDVIHRKIIRKLDKFKEQPIVDMVMTPEGNWLIVAHRGEHIIRTWDIINGYLIDAFRIAQPITSLAMSPDSHFLATTHTNSLGIFLWSNRAIHENLCINSKSIHDLETSVELPTNSMQIKKSIRIKKNVDLDDERNESDASMFSSDSESYADLSETEEIIVTITKHRSNQKSKAENSSSDHSSSGQNSQKTKQIGSHLTLSHLSQAFLNNLENLKFISEKNKLPNDVAEDSLDKDNLPFFLPFKETKEDLKKDDQVFFNTSNEKTYTLFELNELEEKKLKSRQNFNILAAIDDFKDGLILLSLATGDFTMIEDGSNMDLYDNFSHWLMAQSASSIDSFIQCLVSDEAELNLSSKEHSDPEKAAIIFKKSTEIFVQFLIYLCDRFQKKRDIDFATSCLSLVFKYHFNIIKDQMGKKNVDTFDHPDPMEVDEGETRSQIEFHLRNCFDLKSLLMEPLKKKLSMAVCLVDFIRNPISQIK